MRSKKTDKLLAEELDIAIRGRASKILEKLLLKDEEKILDAGCGPGYYLELISKIISPKTKLVGLDLDEEALKTARKRVGMKVELKKGNIYHLPFSENIFDWVILSEVLEHLEDDKKTLREVYKVLKPGGHLLITVPNQNYPLFWDPINWTLEHLFGTHIKKGFWAGIWTNHLRLYKKTDLLKKIRGVGFEIDEAVPLTRFCLPFNKNLLYGGKLPARASKNLIKKLKSQNKPLYIKVMLTVVEVFHKINSSYQAKEIGVSLFVKAVKPS